MDLDSRLGRLEGTCEQMLHEIREIRLLLGEEPQKPTVTLQQPVSEPNSSFHVPLQQ
ncbi:hypothetical protein [Corynebacterium pyruviciproducens]|uniref:hypothetical protein n=1 Tax=Corynebacterium pyruviciproducens TaxID=598660 RepID=UPI00245545CB|nr:hypothetical protein [Corynebacterium pyruviciproducens]